jgi:BirA family biotin operon repressor/biotin-[acetyl-CoA-carboxylase] ligase
MERLFMGRHLIRLDSVGSTNNYAATLLGENVPEGTLVSAREQTDGRGQRGNIWLSEAGKNLTLTYVLRPGFVFVTDQFLLNKAIAIAVARTAELINPGSFIRIKWPNDIFLDNRKLAGILVETSVKGSQIVSCLAGIGMNVNQVQFPEGSGNPISLAIELERELELEDVMNLLSKQMEVNYLRVKAGQRERICSDYDSLLWKRGEVHDFIREGKPFPAKVICVDDMGRLVVEDDSGVEHAYIHGAIQWF